MRILLVDDVEKLAAYIKKGLVAEGFLVDCAHEGRAAEAAAMSGAFDLIILDLMLPGRDGLSVCGRLRDRGIDTPILMLTALGEIDDRVNGLNAGADDYLIKPFDFAELVARVRALLRRPGELLPDVVELGDLSVDLSGHTVSRDGTKVKLSPKEFTLLEYLLRNKNIVLTREQIISNCWGWDSDSYSNVVDVYIKKLRRKLEQPGVKFRKGKAGYIRTVRGTGYVIED